MDTAQVEWKHICMAWHTKLVVGGGSEMRVNGEVWWVWKIGGGDSGMRVKGWAQLLCTKGVTVRLAMVFWEVCSRAFAVIVVGICLWMFFET